MIACKAKLFRSSLCQVDVKVTFIKHIEIHIHGVIFVLFGAVSHQKITIKYVIYNNYYEISNMKQL